MNRYGIPERGWSAHRGDTGGVGANRWIEGETFQSNVFLLPSRNELDFSKADTEHFTESQLHRFNNAQKPWLLDSSRFPEPYYILYTSGLRVLKLNPEDVISSWLDRSDVWDTDILNMSRLQPVFYKEGALYSTIEKSGKKAQIIRDSDAHLVMFDELGTDSLSAFSLSLLLSRDNVNELKGFDDAGLTYTALSRACLSGQGSYSPLSSIQNLTVAISPYPKATASERLAERLETFTMLLKYLPEPQQDDVLLWSMLFDAVEFDPDDFLALAASGLPYSDVEPYVTKGFTLNQVYSYASNSIDMELAESLKSGSDIF